MRSGSGQSDVDRVRQAIDLAALIGEHVSLQRRGRELVGLCPFHDDHKPSFAVVTHKGDPFYKCHSCGAAGDAFTFVQNYHKLDFGETLRYLADRAGITLTPFKPEGGRSGEAAENGGAAGDGRISSRTLLAVNEQACAFFERSLASPAGQAMRAVFAERGYDDETTKAFRLGAALDGWDNFLQTLPRDQSAVRCALQAGLLKQRPNGSTGFYDTFRNRAIFPICDELGRPIAFGGRRVKAEDDPKYLNSPESAIFNKSKTLYALHLAKRAIIESGVAIVSEGYTDVIACHRAGIINVIATLGTALTREHATALGRLCSTVVLVFDGDEAGQRAADRAVEVFFAGRVDVRIAVLPEKKDPDDLLREPGGVERFRAAIANGSEALRFKHERFRQRLAGATSLSGRQTQLEEFMAELNRLGYADMPGVRRSLVASRLADLLRLPLHEIDRLAQRTARLRPGASANASADPDAKPRAAEGDARNAPECDPSDDFALITPRRRRAERGPLAMLLFAPELWQSEITLPAGERAPLRDLLHEESFLHRPHQRLAETVLDCLVRGAAVSVPVLLEAFPTAEMRRLVVDLFTEGEQLCTGREPERVERLEEAVRALLREAETEKYEQSLEELRPQVAAGDMNSLAAVLAGRQRQGFQAAALARVRG